jgi:hypothetical protein
LISQKRRLECPNEAIKMIRIEREVTPENKFPF